MPGSCSVVGCTNHTMMRGIRPSFHSFPRNPERRYCWILALQKKRYDGSTWTPSSCARICGNHFIQGKPDSDPRHPDYVPTIFPYNKADSRFHARKRRSLARHERLVGRETNIPSGSAYKRRKDSTLEKSSHTDHDYATLQGQKPEGQPKDIFPRLAATYSEQDKKAVWLYTVQGGRVVNSIRCPDSVRVDPKDNRPPLSGILMANLLPEESQTPSSQALSQPATSSALPPPSEPKVMPPCTQDMLFDEITALRSERDKALDRVKEMQSKLDAMGMKLKRKNERLLKQTCSKCHKTLNSGLAGMPRAAKSQSNEK